MKSPEEILETAEKYRCDPAIVTGVLARVPPSWGLVQREEDGAAFRRGGIQVIVSVSYQQDHRIWIHVSACGRRTEKDYYLPSWEDMKRVKHDFIGPDRWAYQVFPNEAEYINHNPYVLHLFALLEGEPALPDFCKGTGTL
jgi:hypothetical protein